jgi:hypothetical protein
VLRLFCLISSSDVKPLLLSVLNVPVLNYDPSAKHNQADACSNGELGIRATLLYTLLLPSALASLLVSCALATVLGFCVGTISSRITWTAAAIGTARNAPTGP